VTHYLLAGREYIRFSSQFGQGVETRALTGWTNNGTYTHHIGYTHPPEMPYYRRGYPHALWSSILPRCMPLPCGSWMSSGLVQPIRNYSKRFTGTKNLRWNLDLFPSSMHHVWISSQLVSAN